MKDFPRGTNPKLGTPTYYLAKFSRNLQEMKKRKLRGGKGVQNFTAWIRYCFITFIRYFPVGHADRTIEHIYIELQTENNKNLLLSKGHLLHVGCYNNLKAAREVTKGDVLLVTSQGGLQHEVVTKVTTVVKKGAYCPHTTGMVNLYTKSVPHV